LIEERVEKIKGKKKKKEKKTKSSGDGWRATGGGQTKIG
jgi:hypothetical protein